MLLGFKKLSEDAIEPSRGSEQAAGIDLFYPRNSRPIVIPPLGTDTIDIAIQITLPEGCYGRIAPRSGLARYNHIDVGGGVIDRDYRGPIKVILNNLDKTNAFTVQPNSAIAQLICEKIIHPEIYEITDAIPKTKRGNEGFGSTDRKK